MHFPLNQFPEIIFVHGIVSEKQRVVSVVSFNNAHIFILVHFAQVVVNELISHIKHSSKRYKVKI